MPNKDPQKRREYCRQWRIRNRDSIRERAKRWRLENPEKEILHWKNNNFKRQEKIRNILNQLKVSVGGKCQRCGYNKCLEILEFHHINPSDKEFEIPRKISKSGFRDYASLSGEILDETKKCELLCPNCHRIEHFGKCNPLSHKNKLK